MFEQQSYLEIDISEIERNKFIPKHDSIHINGNPPSKILESILSEMDHRFQSTKNYYY